MKQLQEKMVKKNNSFKKAKEQLEKNTQKAKSQKGNLVLMYASGEIGKDEYELALESINSQLAQYQVKLAELYETDTNLDNVANIILFSKLGASVTTIVTITGQMIMGILIDNFGWFGIPVNPVSITRTLGAVIMIFAISLVQPKKKKELTRASEEEKKDSKITWIILGVLAGVLPPLQTAINGKLRVATGSLLGATFISFFVGMIILIILILITQRRLELPLYDTEKSRIPIWVYMAGIFGIFIVAGNIVLLPVLGSVLTTMIFILGQMLMALTIDQFGIFNLQKRKIDGRRIAALVLTIIGIIFVKFL